MIHNNIIPGRMKKFLAENTLLGQAFVINPDLTVEQAAKEAGVEITGYARVMVGEGVERRKRISLPKWRRWFRADRRIGTTGAGAGAAMRPAPFLYGVMKKLRRSGEGRSFGALAQGTIGDEDNEQVAWTKSGRRTARPEVRRT